MAVGKSKQPAILLLHTLVIAAVMAVGLVFFVPPDGRVIAFAGLNGIAHLITDACSWKGYRWYVRRMFTEEDGTLRESDMMEYRYWEDHWFYTTIGFDQMLHGLALIILAGVLL